MSKSKTVNGKLGKVKAKFCSERNPPIDGEIVPVLITGLIADTGIPLEVKKAMVGQVFNTIFTRKQVVDHYPDVARSLPEGCRLAYAMDIVDAFLALDQKDAAERLLKVTVGELDMCVIDYAAFQTLDIEQIA